MFLKAFSDDSVSSGFKALWEFLLYQWINSSKFSNSLLNLWYVWNHFSIFTICLRISFTCKYWLNPNLSMFLVNSSPHELSLFMWTNSTSMIVIITVEYPAACCSTSWILQTSPIALYTIVIFSNNINDLGYFIPKHQLFLCHVI